MNHDEELLKHLPVFACNMEDEYQKIDVDRLVNLLRLSIGVPECKIAEIEADIKKVLAKEL